MELGLSQKGCELRRKGERGERENAEKGRMQSKYKS